MADTDWIAPQVQDLEKVLSQLVLNATERMKNQPMGASNSRGTENLRMAVARVRAAILAGGQSALSQTAGSVPPEAEQHALMLAARAMTGSTPNVGSVVVSISGGVYSPFDTLVKAAEKWLADVQSGAVIPTNPTNPQQAGDGAELAPVGDAYGDPPSATVAGLMVGLQYLYAPGPNEVSLACGATTLTAAGSFVASAASATLTGSQPQVPVTASVQLSVAARNTTKGGNIEGQVDMSTDGPLNFGVII